jgi:hypothetical protein
MPNQLAFDVNSWKDGANHHSEGEDFDVNKWENALVNAGPLGIQPPKLDMQEDRGAVPGG